MSNKAEIVVVYSGNSVDASFVKGLLEADRIKVFLKDEIMGTLAPWYVTPGGAGAVKVVVAKKDLNRARAIVQEFLDEKSNK